MERWNGKLGMGNLVAKKAMARAIELAGKLGIGCVAVRNTNHWMRGGTYGWQAADAGCIGICWTNTFPNMPAWGGTDPRIGNNPFVLAIPVRMDDTSWRMGR
jgi:3-dehydro-L-gulonate 2-dehydrogenase